MPGKSKSKKSSKAKNKWSSKSKNGKSTVLPASEPINLEEQLIKELIYQAEDFEIETNENCAICVSTTEPEQAEQAAENAVSVEADPKSLELSDTPSTVPGVPSPTGENIKSSSDDSDSDHYSDCEPEEYKLGLESGYGVNIVYREEGGQCRLDTAALTQVVERSGAGALPVVLVSVAGACRGGKSFLLDFMLRYLYAQASGGSATEEWLGGEEEPLRGFSWRGGTRRDTTGIMLWSQPIPVTLPTGEEVAVLLMDTQGAFDEQSSLRDSSLVFALSTLLSSLQVYNISQQIREDDLQHLQLFTEYAAAGGDGLAALLLLLRDWSVPYEYPYGAAGGDRYLTDKLQVKEDQPQELRSIRQQLAATFDSMSCFLLPHPGPRAAADPNFQGKLSELTPEFKRSLRELVPLVLAPERLRVKTVAGRPLAARDLPLLLQTYLHEFTTRVPTPLSVLSANARAAWLMGACAARAAVCAAATARALPRGAMRARLAAAASAAREPLRALADRANDLQGLADLETELDALVDHYADLNNVMIDLAILNAKDSFESVVRGLDREDLCLHPLDLAATVQGARDAAMALFDCDEGFAADPELAQLAADLEERSSVALPRLSAVNAANNDAAVEAARASLRALPRGCAHAADLAAAHSAAAARATDVFRRHRNTHTTQQHDEYATQLEEHIERYLRTHEIVINLNNRRAKNDALRIYGTSVNLTDGCWRPDFLDAKHEEVKERVIESFYDRREGPNSRTRDEFVEEIESELSIRYDKLREGNELKNKTAVNDAYKKFCLTMDEASRGFRMKDSELQIKLDDAFRGGIVEFKKKRVLAGRLDSFHEDFYFDLLVQKMRGRYAHYRNQNREKLSGSEVASAAAAVGGAAVAAVVSPRVGLPALFGAVIAALIKRPGSD